MSEERDDTNRGVFFKPKDDQKLAGSGKLNVDGKERRIAIIREPVKKDGDPLLVVYAKVGVLFPIDEEKRTNEASPTVSGPLELGADLRIAGWPGEKDGRKYMSLKVSKDQREKKEEKADPWGDAAKPKRRQPILDDEIPF